MTVTPDPGAARAATGTGVRLLTDGDCGFCQASARWARRALRPDVPLVTWQAEADGLDPLVVAMAQDAVVLMNGSRPVATGAAAVSLVLSSSRRRWARLLGAVLRLPGVCLLAEAGYRLVARNRHRLSRGASCRVG